MADDCSPRAQNGEALWRTHHEVWKRGDLNQREYCEAQGPLLKALGSRRAKFKAEPRLPARRLLYRRGGPSHTLSHILGQVTYLSLAPPPDPIAPLACRGRRRRLAMSASLPKASMILASLCARSKPRQFVRSCFEHA